MRAIIEVENVISKPHDSQQPDVVFDRLDH
jgi:hypothetical protein